MQSGEQADQLGTTPEEKQQGDESEEQREAHGAACLPVPMNVEGPAGFKVGRKVHAFLPRLFIGFKRRDRERISLASNREIYWFSNVTHLFTRSAARLVSVSYFNKTETGRLGTGTLRRSGRSPAFRQAIKRDGTPFSADG